MGLRAQGIGYETHGDEGRHRILVDVDLFARPGEIVDVVGPSGAGKTTLLRALARLLPSATGSLSLAGTDSSEISPQEWRTRVTLLPQVTSLLPGTVRSNLLLPWTLKSRHEQTPPDDDRLMELLAWTGLGEISLDRDASRLSVGQSARIALLRVLLTEPDVLLLDEPDASLDDESAAQVTEMTRRFAHEGGAVVRVRHLRSDEAATRRLRLEAGELREVGQ